MITFDEYQRTLGEFIRYQSISTDPAFETTMHETVAWLSNTIGTSRLHDRNLARTHHEIPSSLHNMGMIPIKKTVLVYGHYDVQPAEQEDGWGNDPFYLG